MNLTLKILEVTRDYCREQAKQHVQPLRQVYIEQVSKLNGMIRDQRYNTPTTSNWENSEQAFLCRD